MVSLLRLLVLAGALLVVVAAVAGWFVFVPRAPAPGGPHPVGRMELTLEDSRGQPIAVTVWYPAPLDARAPAPLILHSPGWGGLRMHSSIQTANLASHGFVVVGCDDIASDPALDPDKGVFLELATDAATAGTIERAGRHAVLQGGRLLEILRALEAGQAPLLAGRVDLKRIGVLGYSIGGTAGLAAASVDPRIVAVFNLDGGIFGPATTDIVPPAYFILSSLEAFPPESELSSPDPFIRNYALISAMDLPHHRRRMERPGGYWVQLPRAEHGDLADALFAPSRRKMFRTNFERSAMNGAIEAFETAFFRSALRGEPHQLLALAGRSDRTVRWISPTSPAAGATTTR